MKVDESSELTETSNKLSAKPKKPGIVIFVAVLHFVFAGLFLFLSLFCVVAMFFGATWGLDDYLTHQMMPRVTTANFSYGLMLIFGVVLFVFLCFLSFFLAMGIGLLKGKKFAWYLQVVLSTLGLLSVPLGFLWSLFILPIGSILNLVILIFFFQSHVRNYFKV